VKVKAIVINADWPPPSLPLELVMSRRPAGNSYASRPAARGSSSICHRRRTVPGTLRESREYLFLVVAPLHGFASWRPSFFCFELIGKNISAAGLDTVRAFWTCLAMALTAMAGRS